MGLNKTAIIPIKIRVLIQNLRSSFTLRKILIHRKIENLLESQMVTKIDAIGKHFQPWEFEALQYKETKDCEENIVVEVIKEGYKFNGQILRPAQVIVSKAVQIQEDKPQEEIK